MTGIRRAVPVVLSYLLSMFKDHLAAGVLVLIGCKLYLKEKATICIAHCDLSCRGYPAKYRRALPHALVGR